MLYYQGPNPTVDLIVTKCKNNERFVLMIRRGLTSDAEAGKWALPGGFINTTAAKGKKWQLGSETEIEAAKRELREESGLDLSFVDDHKFLFIGIYDALNRDPRNSKKAWVESHVYKVKIDENEGVNIQGADDAELADWFSFSKILKMSPEEFAFDHYKILLEHLL